MIQQLFDNLRNYDGENTYPKSCGRFKVSGIRDLTTGYDSSQPDQKAVSTFLLHTIMYMYVQTCKNTLQRNTLEHVMFNVESKMSYIWDECFVLMGSKSRLISFFLFLFVLFSLPISPLPLPSKVTVCRGREEDLAIVLQQSSANLCKKCKLDGLVRCSLGFLSLP